MELERELDKLFVDLKWHMALGFDMTRKEIAEGRQAIAILCKMDSDGKYTKEIKGYTIFLNVIEEVRYPLK